VIQPDEPNEVLEFSIITVTLNSESSIQRCIDSIRNQSLKNFEYIVIDGNSNDQTLQIIEKNRDVVSRVVSESDDGLYYAMNKGLKLAKGRIIGILNSDDEYLPDALHQVSLALHQNPECGVIYGSVINSRQHDDILEIYINEIPVKMIPHPATFVTKETYGKLGYFNTNFRVAADYELILRCRKEGIGFQKIDLPLAVMRPGGYSAKHRFRSITETISLHFLYREKGFLRISLRESKYFLASILNRQ